MTLLFTVREEVGRLTPSRVLSCRATPLHTSVAASYARVVHAVVVAGEDCGRPAKLPPLLCVMPTLPMQLAGLSHHLSAFFGGVDDADALRMPVTYCYG